MKVDIDYHTFDNSQDPGRSTVSKFLKTKRPDNEFFEHKHK